MLSSKNGYSPTRENSYQDKRAFAEFWGTVEFPRVLLGSPGDVAASFQSSFLNVLTASEQLSFQEARKTLSGLVLTQLWKVAGPLTFLLEYTLFQRI